MCTVYGEKIYLKRNLVSVYMEGTCTLCGFGESEYVYLFCHTELLIANLTNTHEGLARDSRGKGLV